MENHYIQSSFLQYKNAQYSCNFLANTRSEPEVKQWKPFCKLASKSILGHPLFLILPEGKCSAAEDGKHALFITPYCYACKLKLSLKFFS